MVNNKCAGVVFAEREPRRAGHLLELVCEAVKADLPELTLQELHWFLDALGNGDLTGTWLEQLPASIGDMVGMEALNYPENSALREEMENLPTDDTFARLAAMPERQFASRLASLKPAQALALTVIGTVWLRVGSRADIHASLFEAFKVRAA